MCDLRPYAYILYEKCNLLVNFTRGGGGVVERWRNPSESAYSDVTLLLFISD